jgi:GcrA cell cycle regulator
MDSLIGTSPTKKYEWFKWTDERVELLTKLLSDGCSCSQIAAELGGITRNAVIGKIHRMGLVGPKARVTTKPWVEAGVSERTWHRHRAKASHRTFEARGGASYRRNRSAPAHSFEAVIIGDEATDLAPEVIANPVTLMELQEHHCRWPHDVAGEPMMYCGADSFVEIAGRHLPYCARHCRMAYRLPERRRAA